MAAVGMKMKKWFFDRQRVHDAVDRATIKALSRAGAFIRQRARMRVLRRRKETSRPGQPPSVHSRDAVATLRNILFAYEPNRQSVVVGPVKLNTVFFDGDGKPVSGTVPGTLEHGGTIHVLQWEVRPGVWTRVDLRSRRRMKFRKKRLHKVQIEARPYMSVALAAEAPKFPNLFANSVKPG